MCGILGTVNCDVKESMFQFCLDRLAHRGPDGEGIWHDERVWLGHRRLAILDLGPSGRQPMMYANGRYVITYNGEIYNFVELKRELESKGYQFASETDTEVILAAYCEWGEECQNRFNGMWAFAIYDRQEKDVFLSRDRYGVKPLFYSKISEGIAFASEMKALIPLLPQCSANMRLLHEQSTTLYEATDECLILEIKRLPAGYCASIDRKTGKMRVRQWYAPLMHIKDNGCGNYPDSVEHFRELFLDACKIRMRSDVPIGTALSGGLDSSATISCMVYIGGVTDAELQRGRVSRDWQHAFIASMPGTSLDETKYACEVTEYLGIKETVVAIDPVKYWDKIGDYMYLFEEMHSTSPVPMMALYGEERRSGIVVTIDGHGADEMYGGYTFNFIHAFRDAGFNPRQIGQVAKAYIDAFPESGNLALSNPSVLKLWTRYKLKAYRQILMRQETLSSMYPEKEWAELDYLNKVLYRSTFLTILPTLLRNYDRYSMANGVEIRMPFMDYRLVEEAFALNWDYKIRNGYSKAIIRDATAAYMPESIAYRKGKIGFNTPILEWMQGELKEWFLEEVNSEDFRTCAFINAQEVKQSVIKLMQNEKAKFDEATNCWSQLSPYFWEKYFYKRAVAAVGRGLKFDE